MQFGGPSHGEMQSAVEQAHGRAPRRRTAPLWLSMLLAGLGVLIIVAMALFAYLGG